MRKLILHGPLACLALALALFTCPVAWAAESSPRAENTAPKSQPGKQRKLPFRGKIVVVNKASGTITIGKREFKVTPETKLLKDSKSVRLENLAPGDLVTGSYSKGEDGKLVAASVYVGGKSANAKAEKE
jgi:hypothetical protein